MATELCGEEGVGVGVVVVVVVVCVCGWGGRGGEEGERGCLCGGGGARRPYLSIIADACTYLEWQNTWESDSRHPSHPEPSATHSC